MIIEQTGCDINNVSVQKLAVFKGLCFLTDVHTFQEIGSKFTPPVNASGSSRRSLSSHRLLHLLTVKLHLLRAGTSATISNFALFDVRLHTASFCEWNFPTDKVEREPYLQISGM